MVRAHRKAAGGGGVVGGRRGGGVEGDGLLISRHGRKRRVSTFTTNTRKWADRRDLPLSLPKGGAAGGGGGGGPAGGSGRLHTGLQVHNKDRPDSSHLTEVALNTPTRAMERDPHQEAQG